jgi:hypothetical protein
MTNATSPFGSAPLAKTRRYCPGHPWQQRRAIRANMALMNDDRSADTEAVANKLIQLVREMLKVCQEILALVVAAEDVLRRP